MFASVESPDTVPSRYLIYVLIYVSSIDWLIWHSVHLDLLTFEKPGCFEGETGQLQMHTQKARRCHLRQLQKSIHKLVETIPAWEKGVCVQMQIAHKTDWSLIAEPSHVSEEAPSAFRSFLLLRISFSLSLGW